MSVKYGRAWENYLWQVADRKRDEISDAEREARKVFETSPEAKRTEKRVRERLREFKLSESRMKSVVEEVVQGAFGKHWNEEDEERLRQGIKNLEAEVKEALLFGDAEKAKQKLAELKSMKVDL